MSRTKKRERLGIQSVEVAAQILHALTRAGRPLALKDLARLARLHPGKVHRYLVSLTRTELVLQDAASGHYGVGPMSIALGLAGLRSADVVRAAAALLPALRDEISETVLLALWSAQGPVVFDLEESTRPVYMNIRVGSLLPMVRTATGRVFAAFLPKDETAGLIEAEFREARKANSPWADAGPFRRLLEQARASGLACVQGDLIPGVNAIAAPIFDHKSRVVAVVGALGRSEELNVDFNGPVAEALRRTAVEISRRLGHNTISDNEKCNS